MVKKHISGFSKLIESIADNADLPRDVAKDALAALVQALAALLRRDQMVYIPGFGTLRTRRGRRSGGGREARIVWFIPLWKKAGGGQLPIKCGRRRKLSPSYRGKRIVHREVTMEQWLRAIAVWRRQQAELYPVDMDLLP